MIMLMSLETLVFLGIAFNIAVLLISRSMDWRARGVDSLPAVPIIAGVLYGSNAGILAGLVVSAAYYAAQPGRLGYAPITVLMNVAVGFLAHFLSFAGVFGAGIILLIFYHVASGIIVSLVSDTSSGYFSFAVMNFVTTLVLLILASSVSA